VAAYCTNGFRAVEALRASGYSTPNKLTMNSWAYRILKMPNVVQAIRIFVDGVLEPYRAGLELQVFDLYYKRAMYTVDLFFKSNGDVKPLDQIPKEWMVVIDRVIKRTFPTKEGPVDSVEYILADRDTALQTLLKFVAKFTGDFGDSNALPGETQSKLQAIFQVAQREQEKLRLVGSSEAKGKGKGKKAKKEQVQEASFTVEPAEGNKPKKTAAKNKAEVVEEIESLPDGF